MARRRTIDPATFEALGHPIRLRMIEMMAGTDELACTTLEEALPIVKSTISYHIKILYRAGLIDVRRDGRWYHYRLRRQVLGDRVEALMQALASPPRSQGRRASGGDSKAA